MKAGDLDRRITIERAIKTPDGLGGSRLSWVAVAVNVPASKRDVSDGERVRAAEVGATIETRFQVRWGLGVTPQDRVVCEGRVYNLVGVKEIGRHEGQELSAIARAE